jgi:hypothetical protein
MLPVVILASCAVFFAALSHPFFRMRHAASLSEKGSFDRSIRVYESILRRGSVSRSRDESLEALVRLRMAELFDKKGMRARAMREYYHSMIIAPDGRNTTSLRPRTPEEYRDFAMTILEDKPGKDALVYLSLLNDSGADWDVYKDIARVIKAEPSEYYFTLASAYIDRQLWTEARLYLTSRILRFVHPLSVLRFAFERYGADDARHIRDTVWGKDVFVTIRDFEQEAYPIFSHWVSRSLPRSFTQGFEPQGYRGCAEYLDVTYPSPRGYDLWVVITNVPLDHAGFDVGARLYCSSDSVLLNANVMYPAENKSALFNSCVVTPVREGWFEYSLGPLRKLAGDFARTSSWKTKDMYFDKFVVDTQGKSGRIAIDEIQLYVYAQ